MRVLTATAPHVTLGNIGGRVAVHDGNTGRRIGTVDRIRGFAHYTGVKGGAHEGVRVVVAGGVEALVRALADGVRNGRDDRDNGV